MDIKELYTDLSEAYSNENLNHITGKLILLYKNKNFGSIREYANKISNYVSIDEQKDAKCFSKLMMLYHPDKGAYFRKTIQQLYEQNDYESLHKHAHILLVLNIDIAPVSGIDEDIEYNPEYVWDINDEDGYSYSDSDDDSDFEPDEFERSFYNLIKIRVYGRVDVEFPAYYLEDYEEFELAYSGLESIDGVEHCIHIKILDISNNAISDLENLWNLEGIEELYLANNQIGYIDTLSNLINLKILDISENQIDDISPLYELNNLEFVNLIGNPVSENQIQILEQNGVIVMTERMPAYNMKNR